MEFHGVQRIMEETWDATEKDAYSYKNVASHCGQPAVCEKGVTTDSGALLIFHLISAIWRKVETTGNLTGFLTYYAQH